VSPLAVIVFAAFTGAGMLSLCGAMARPFDLGRRQGAFAAEAAALGAAAQLPDAIAARRMAARLVQANQQDVPGPDVSCDADTDIEVYRPHDATPLPSPFDRLGPQCMAVTVTTHAASLLADKLPLPAALRRFDCSRTVARGPAAEAVCDPVYILAAEPLQIGRRYECSYVKDPLAATEGGVSFGWMELAGEADEGAQLAALACDPSARLADGRPALQIGDVVQPRRPQNAEAWLQALVGDGEHPGRLYRAAQKPYCEQDMERHSSRHPRLLIVPLVSSGPQGLEVRSLVAMWLEAAQIGADGSLRITLQPVRHTLPRGKVAPAAAGATLYAREVVD